MISAHERTGGQCLAFLLYIQSPTSETGQTMHGGHFDDEGKHCVYVGRVSMYVGGELQRTDEIGDHPASSWDLQSSMKVFRALYTCESRSARDGGKQESKHDKPSNH